MCAFQYVTLREHEFVKRPVFQSQPLAGAVCGSLSETPVNTGFLGFGVAITGSSCYELSLMEPEERRKFLQSLYGKDGLGLRVGRISVGASDYSPEAYSYDDTENDIALKDFSIDRDRAYILPMLKEILAVNPDLYLLASPWSPPGWMKTSGSLGGGYMRDKFVECYAEYIIKFLKAYEKEGIRIRAITPQNEPDTQQAGKMPACVWHPDIEAHYIDCLSRRLKEEKSDVEIWMHDHNFANFRVGSLLKEYPALEQQCSGIAFHYYTGTIEEATEALKDETALKKHFTEGGPRLDDHYGDDWCKWSNMMVKVLTCGFSSFCGWNLMLDELGGPNVGPFFCGGLVTRNSITGELSESGQWKALRHIAPFVDEKTEVYPMDFSDAYMPMSAYPKHPIPLVGCLLKNPGSADAVIIVNGADKKRQVQFPYAGKSYYIEMLPESVATVVFE